MSGVLAVIETDARLLGEREVGRMVGALRPRGDRSEIWRSNEAALAVTRFDWELADGYSGPGFIVHDGEIVVAADATLIYRDDLCRRLLAAGIAPAGPTPSHLIAAAYRAWGHDCAAQLEGDFAFVLYDRAQRRVFAARDFMGRRGLHYVEFDGGILIASTVSALVAHPRCPRDFDDVALAETLTIALSGESRTPYKAVHTVPAATWLSRDPSGTVRTGAYWHFPSGDVVDSRPFDSATEQLRELIGNAIAERLAPDGPTTIWLSGGYDSPALYAVGNATMRAAGGGQLRPISVSFPPGDPGREDEFIDEIARFWQADTTWLSVDDIPLLHDIAAHAAAADVPLQHSFENWIHALLAASRREGSRVAIYGDGGDQLFAVSSVFMHDLFGSLRWLELNREWRARGGKGVRGLWEAVARPVCGELVRAIRRDRRVDMAPPSWLRQDFVRRNAIVERQQQKEWELRNGMNRRAWAETKGSLANPVIPRVGAAFSALGLEHGVEPRAPLLDRRIVEFALARPREERASGGAVKHLLRRAANGLLPPRILLPRGRKTGVLTGYFARSFRADPHGVVAWAFEEPILAELGIVDAESLRRAWLDYQSGTGPESGSGGHLFVALQTELWLRARSTGPQFEQPETSQHMRMSAAGFVQ